MPEIVVAAEPRTETGTNVNRRLRAAERIPGVVYGGKKDPRAVSVSPWASLGLATRNKSFKNTRTVSLRWPAATARARSRTASRHRTVAVTANARARTTRRVTAESTSLLRRTNLPAW